MRKSLLTFVVATFAVAACSKDSTGLDTGGGTTTTPTVYNVAFDSGIVDSTAVTVGTSIPIRIHVTKAGAAVPNAPVTWTISAGHGSVSSASTTTDANGGTFVSWTVGDTAGVNTISATAFDASATIRAIGTAGAAASILKVSSDSSAVVAGASIPLTVRVVDRGGNAVNNTNVAWTTTGGTLTASSSTSGANGNATTVLTTSAKGSFSVTATLAGKGTVTYKVVAF